MQAIKFVLAAAIAALVSHSYNLKAAEKEKEPKEFLGKILSRKFHHSDAYSIRDLFVEDVPGTKSYWLGPWVETVAVKGVDRFYIIKGYNRFYVNAAFLGDSHLQFLSRSTGLYELYGPFKGKPSDHFKLPAEQGDAAQPTTAVDSKPEGSEKPKPESEGRPQ